MHVACYYPYYRYSCSYIFWPYHPNLITSSIYLVTFYTFILVIYYVH